MNRNTPSDPEDIRKDVSKNSRAFQQGVSVLWEEIRLAIHWNRPSILLAITPARLAQQKAQAALQSKLRSLSRDVLVIQLGGAQTDLFQAMERVPEPDRYVFFVEGVGENKDTYHSLNLRREVLVEKKRIVVFWLTEQEATELPRSAPDFWAFRHRVVAFAASRGSRQKVLPAGLLLWQPDHRFWMESGIKEKITFQEELLRTFPSTDESLAMRAEAVYTLAGFYWVQGETQKASQLLQKEFPDPDRLPLPDLAALALNGRAILAYEQGRFDVAEELLKHAAALNSHNAMLLANLAVTSYALRRGLQAIGTLKQAIRQAPGSAELWFILGYIHFSLGQLDAALSSFEECIRLFPEHAVARYALAVCRKTIGAEDGEPSVPSETPHTTLPDAYQAVCRAALLGDTTMALTRLRTAVADGIIPPGLARRDPTLHLLFDPTQIEALR